MTRFFLLLLLTPTLATAQGVLGGQGFGYPVSGHSARAAGTAGAMSPFDELTPLNPASVALWTRGAMYFHAEPERRQTRVGGAEDNTSVTRFPLFGIAAKVSEKASLSLTFATMLDRSYETASRTTEQVGNETVDVTTQFKSTGAINDVRAAIGWRFSETLRAGAGVHLFTGENRLTIGRDFPDTVPLADVSSNATYSFFGTGVSLGVDWRPLKNIGVGAHTRIGGTLDARLVDTLVGSASVPFQFGAGVRYDGMPGTVFAASWTRTQWSDMDGLGSAGLSIRDADDISAGVETRGPTVMRTATTLRAGLRQRTLPFDLGTSEVKETSFAFGVGYPLALGRASVNLAAQRALRSGGGAKENAWLFSFGLAIVP
jgi:hypothetical protein